METRKKKKKSNLIMVLLIAVIVFCGVMAVGGIKGWFGGSDSPMAVEDITGTVNIERSGVGYSLEKGTTLEAGDIIEAKGGSEVSLSINRGNALELNENTELTINDCQPDNVDLTLTKGEIFEDVPKAPKNLEVTFGENIAKVAGTVFSVSAQQGSTSLSVYEGAVEVTAEDGSVNTVESGKTISVIHSGDGTLDVEINDIQTAALSNFIIDKMISCNSKGELCFSQDEIEKVAAEREKENSKAADGSTDVITTTSGSSSSSSSGANPESSSGDSSGANLESSSGDSSGANPESSSGDSSGTNPESSSGDSSGTKVAGECTITIRCNTILDNMGNLTAGKDKYVPSNGIILATSTVEFAEGETVFDVLQRVCSYAGIHLEYSYTPLYESYYIEGINHLYEFDCGPQSGWMYKVNGWFPNYGCSSYTLKDGDNIVWDYTCNGLGADVGGRMN